jgi:outer membrane protein assembly factor BamB
MLHVIGADGTKIRTIDVGSYVPGSAALADGRAFVGNHEGRFLCADLSTGRIVWTYDQAAQPFVSSPAVGATRVVVGSGEGLHCIDRRTGRRIWALATREKVDSSPVICGGKVVFGCDDGKLYVLRLADGKEVWSYEVGQGITSSPAVAGGMIIVGCLDGALYVFGRRW